MAEQAFLPGTNTFATKSFDDRLLDVVEFDDALLDQAIWKNPRYDGSKAIGQRVNFYEPTDRRINKNLTSSGDYLGKFVTIEEGRQVWGGDISYGLNPVIQNQTTALYIANTVIGGTEDPQFATIQNHSYIGINKIVVIDHDTDEVQVLDRNVEGFEEFHRFITNDLPTGASFNMKLLDNSISNNIKSEAYRVKMNKGYLLKTFDFNFVPSNGACSLSTNNSMYLYNTGSSQRDVVVTGSFTDPAPPQVPQGLEIRFRYAVINMFQTSTDNEGPLFDKSYIGPSFASSSIVNNKFTRQFYSGSYGFIQDSFTGDFNNERIANSGLGSASKFIGINCLDFLKANNENPDLTEEEKTEIHVTFFEGTKDFAPGYFDERSISTFEVDQNQKSLDIGDHCNAFLPTSHEIIFKGVNDHRFIPLLQTHQDALVNAYLQNSSSVAYAGSGSFGCTHKTTVPGQFAAGSLNFMQPGVNLDQVVKMEVFVQGGQIGEFGHQGDLTSSNANFTASHNPALAPFDGTAGKDATYSGSFNYELSFLDKDHTIIADIDKDAELFDGIGDRGLVLIPEFTHISVKSNLDFYLKKAGLITEAPPTKTEITKQNYPLLSVKTKPNKKLKR